MKSPEREREREDCEITEIPIGVGEFLFAGRGQSAVGPMGLGLWGSESLCLPHTQPILNTNRVLLVHGMMHASTTRAASYSSRVTRVTPPLAICKP